ncbi:MAG TPA: lysine--tRNA ligase, partial [Candidatus Nanoarchaeia archaeon]|nr:lysine--tRNA ligase [Candidatus Nanoarchaeia archaeon]
LPLPEKWHGLQDVDERFRKRYLDIISSPDVKKRFIIRSNIVTEIRKVFDKEGYLEVETPILQAVAGGASAEPFRTHHNALDIDMYLRIAPELFLKELLVAGFPKVYEIGRLFRNEGIDVTHNPEFTTIEYYEAFADAKKIRALTEKVIKSVVKKVMGTTVVKFDDKEIDFGKKFEVITFKKLLEQYADIDPFTVTLDEAASKARELGVTVDRGDLVHKVLDNIYKKVARPKLIQPTFITEYPTAFSPLAKHKEGSDGKIIDRFQLVIGGFELVNAFSELNDPIEQRKRFEAQEKNKAQGDKEAQPNDEGYIEAMEHGMPPAGGSAISIDRLTMLLTDTKNIREVILFPTLRPKQD